MYSVHVHVDCLGCAVLLCLVCLFDLACFFLSSFSDICRRLKPELLVRSLLFGLKDVFLITHICRRAEHVCDLNIYTLHCIFSMHEHYI